MSSYLSPVSETRLCVLNLEFRFVMMTSVMMIVIMIVIMIIILMIAIRSIFMIG